MTQNYRDLIPYVLDDFTASTRLSMCESRSIGKFIAPLVPVTGFTGRVKLFGTGGFTAKDNLSNPGDRIRSRNVENGINPVTYDLLSNRHAEAAEIPVDYLRDCFTDSVCDMVSMGSLLDSTLADAVRSILLSHSTKTVALASTSTNYKAGNHFATATAAGLIPWASATSTPISDVARISSDLLMRNAPYRANAMVIGTGLYAKLQDNPQLSGRFANVTVSGTDECILATLFGMTDIYVADDSILNPVTGEFEKIFPANGLLLFNRDQKHKNCTDYMDNVAGRTQFSSFYTYVPNCVSYPGGVEISEPTYISETHSMRSNVLGYFQPLSVGALASGLQATALFVNDMLV